MSERKHAGHKTRETSILSYLEEEPKLGAMQHRVLASIIAETVLKGPPTDREVAKAMRLSDPNAVRPRRFELMEAGLIEEAGKRECTVTGRLALTWRAVKK